MVTQIVAEPEEGRSMDSNIDVDSFFRIFCPGDLDRASEIVENRKLVYYTSAATAQKIIENKEIWFRNAALMSDYSEISYGHSLTRRAIFETDAGERFRTVVDQVFPNVMDEVGTLVDRLFPDWLNETYLSCWSVHKRSEDQNGRLSMWRAYGDVACVVREKAADSFSDQLGIQSFPVNYFSLTDCENRLHKVSKGIINEMANIERAGRDDFVRNIVWMVFLSAIATKHPGFSKEEEWRVWFRPNDLGGGATALTKQVKVVNGLPQEIWTLPLRDDPASGLIQADIGSLLDRIIIGPTAHPLISGRAFVTLLESAGVQNASEKVVVSDIPLRV